MQTFDPNGVGIQNGKLFGLPYEPEEASLIIMPIPWEVTVSYGTGTAKAPQAILDASPQIDYYDPLIPEAWKLGIAMLPIPKEIKKLSKYLRKKAQKYIQALEAGKSVEKYADLLHLINSECLSLKEQIKAEAIQWMNKGKKVALLGGDHSTPLGLIEAYSLTNPGFSVLQIDAHADLREAYEGFTFSHASVMYNALTYEGLGSLVQVGIRDYCEAEAVLMKENPKIHAFTDAELQKAAFMGTSWDEVCNQICEKLSKEVYISLDIDGLEPFYCPNTGTPVPGGLSYAKVVYLIEKLRANGHQIIGFDLNEVGDSEWDAVVGMRLLYKLACNTLA